MPINRDVSAVAEGLQIYHGLRARSDVVHVDVFLDLLLGDPFEPLLAGPLHERRALLIRLGAAQVLQPLPIILPTALADSTFVVFRLAAVIGNHFIFPELLLVALEQRSSLRCQQRAALTVFLALSQHAFTVFSLGLLLSRDGRRPHPIDVLVSLQLLLAFEVFS